MNRSWPAVGQPSEDWSPLPTIVLATRDRRRRVLATLTRLEELAERPRVVVVDNASTDGTASAIRERFADGGKARTSCATSFGQRGFGGLPPRPPAGP